MTCVLSLSLCMYICIFQSFYFSVCFSVSLWRVFSLSTVLRNFRITCLFGSNFICSTSGRILLPWRDYDLFHWRFSLLFHFFLFSLSETPIIQILDTIDWSTIFSSFLSIFESFFLYFLEIFSHFYWIFHFCCHTLFNFSISWLLFLRSIQDKSPWLLRWRGPCSMSHQIVFWSEEK